MKDKIIKLAVLFFTLFGSLIACWYAMTTEFSVLAFGIIWVSLIVIATLGLIALEES